MKKKITKLTIKRDTVAHLTTGKLARAGGGGGCETGSLTTDALAAGCVVAPRSPA